MRQNNFVFNIKRSIHLLVPKSFRSTVQIKGQTTKFYILTKDLLINGPTKGGSAPLRNGVRCLIVGHTEQAFE